MQPDNGSTNSFAHRVGRVPRFWLRAHPWLAVLLSVLLFAWYIWTMRLPSVSLVALASSSAFCTFAIGLVAVAAAQLLLARLISSWVRVPRKGFWSHFIICAWCLILFILSYAAERNELPLQTGFALSRPAMERIADAAIADPANTVRLSGRWAGVYRIDRVETIGKTVVLYIGESDNHGFARIPGARSDKVWRGAEDGQANPHHHADFPQVGHGPNGDLSARRLKGDWFVMYSVYLLIKDGWS